jgi:amino acid transporter
MKKYYLLLFFIAITSITATGQCALCRAQLEGTGNVMEAEAINDGIVYLMVIPYILIALVGYATYKLFQKNKLKKA